MMDERPPADEVIADIRHDYEFDLDRLGLTVLPKEPTEAMLAAMKWEYCKDGVTWERIYRAGVDAYQRVPAVSESTREERGVGRTYLHFDGMAWPNPSDPLEAERALRSGTPTRQQQMVAASFMAAYRQLVIDPQRTRNAKVAGIRTAADA